MAEPLRYEGCDPLLAMNAACAAIATGDAKEIELEWRTTSEDRIDQPGTETVLTITVRREVKHFRMGAGTETEESGSDE